MQSKIVIINPLDTYDICMYLIKSKFRNQKFKFQNVLQLLHSIGTVTHSHTPEFGSDKFSKTLKSESESENESEKWNRTIIRSHQEAWASVLLVLLIVKVKASVLRLVISAQCSLLSGLVARLSAHDRSTSSLRITVSDSYRAEGSSFYTDYLFVFIIRIHSYSEISY